MTPLAAVLLVVLVVALLGVIPVHSWSGGWGYGPSSIVGLVLLVILILAILGRL